MSSKVAKRSRVDGQMNEDPPDTQPQTSEAHEAEEVAPGNDNKNEGFFEGIFRRAFLLI
jgi:hypothetical protein